MKIRKQYGSIIVVLAMLMTTFLTACSSAEIEEKDSGIVKEEVVAEETTVEVAEPAPVEEATPELTVEPTPESTEEPTPEPVVYEGIDMESTLPAGEWTGTFLGIINEPKFVVTNSETNKKVIVEEGQKVLLEEGDVLGVYRNGGGIVGDSGVNVIRMEGFGNIYSKIDLDTFTEESEFKVTVTTPEGDKTISCILVPNN